jgi:hypothetical protein
MKVHEFKLWLDRWPDDADVRVVVDGDEVDFVGKRKSGDHEFIDTSENRLLPEISKKKVLILGNSD